MNDYEGEGQEDPEREYEHGASHVNDIVPEVNTSNDIVPEVNTSVNICFFFTHTKWCHDINPIAKTMNV